MAITIKVGASTAEGIEALKEVSSSLKDTLHTLTGGIRAGLGYLGATDIASLKQRALYVQITAAGRKVGNAR